MIFEKYQTQEDLDDKRKKVFLKLFSSIIFKNRIVYAVLHTVSNQIIKFQRILDDKLNRDI